MYNKSIFIFHRDLRLNDNKGLLEALENSKLVIPVFIFTPEQLVKNEYKSNNSVQFMMESLDDLDNYLKNRGSRIFYFFGKQHEVIKKLINKVSPDTVYTNMDFTHYAKDRDEKIKKVCEDNDVKFVHTEDYLLQPVCSTLTGGGTVYVKYSSYFDKVKNKRVDKPRRNNFSNYYSNSNKIVGEFRGSKDKFYKKNDNIAVRGGRKNALDILNNIDNFDNYNNERDTLHVRTTRLSAYIKYGCVSIREVYHRIKKNIKKSKLIEQLYWREFYHNIGYAHSDKLGDKSSFREKYDDVPYITVKNANKTQKKQWKAWTDGTTGFPVVDAAMREINETGFMHNRGRLIVASFLVKNMFFHPKEGEKYFATKLVDYDMIVNGLLGNWGWVSGSGTDTQPYFRVFNPWLQSKDHDKNCKYIKKWVPELKDVKNEHIHEWYDHHDDDEYKEVSYPKPMLDYSKTKEKVLEKYKKNL